MKTLANFDWRGKVALTRADLNVPLLEGGGVADAARLTAVAPTVRYILERGGGVVLLSHLGRPREGEVDAALSLAQVAPALSQELGMETRFCAKLSDLSDAARVAPGEVVLLENTRFNVGERANDAALAARYATLGDVFVMDAFASAHRAEASTAALADCLPHCAGLLLQREMAALSRVSGNIARPLVGVFGGAKISTKLGVLRRMAALCDKLIIGGGMANTLLLARGAGIGASLAQRDMLDEARAVLDAAGERLLLPVDAVVADSVNGEYGEARETAIDAVGDNEQILDIGGETQAQVLATLAESQGKGTILWNGPLGLFERPAFAGGTNATADAIATATERGAYSLIGGADTIAAARAAGKLDAMSHVSTGGGALLEYLAGDKLPGLAAIGAA